MTINPEQLKIQAPNNISDYIDKLPSVVGSMSATAGKNTISAGNNGINILDLRNLGSVRTLVLLNGHRVVASDVSGVVDIDTLPQGLIDGVDIITGGASAVYGSDAVAGVVNFRLNTKFEGIKGFAQGGESTYGDDLQGNYGITLGTSFAGGRGHFVVDAQYAKNDGVGQLTDRPWYREWGYMANPNWTAANGEPKQIIVPHLNRISESLDGIITQKGPLYGTTFNADGSPRAFQFGTIDRTGSVQSGGEMFGHYAAMALKSSTRRNYVYTRASYDLTDDFNVFASLMHAESKSSTAASYNYVDGTLSVRQDNAYLNPSVRAAMGANGLSKVSYGVVFETPATEDLNRNLNRVLLGLDGSLGGFWNLHASYDYGRTKVATNLDNVLNRVRIDGAMDAVVDPASGRVVCRSTLSNPADGCVPIDMFGRGNVTDAAKKYVLGLAWARREFTQRIASVSIDGQPFETWAGPVDLAFGMDHRTSTIGHSQTDAMSQEHDWLFGNFLPMTGSDSVTETFAETLAPLLADDKLSVNAAVRSADYKYSGRQLAWKLGMTWRPIDPLLVRVMQSRDIRAPNLSELFQTGVTQRQTVRDPFNGGGTTNLERTTVGNRTLQPEIGKTTTLGFVLTPAWLPGFSGALDFYRIKISDAITTISSQQTVDRCFAGDAQICGNVDRGPSGAVIGLRNSPVNIAEEVVHGLDINLAYRVDLPAPDSSLRLSLLATNQTQDRLTTPFTTHNYAGEMGGDSVKWRGNLNADYSQGPLGLGAEARFIGHGVLRTDWVQGVDIDNNYVPSTWYFDLYGSYSFADSHLQAFARVNNVFNRAPLVIATSSGGFNPDIYNVIGRYVSVGLRFNF